MMYLFCDAYTNIGKTDIDLAKNIYKKKMETIENIGQSTINWPVIIHIGSTKQTFEDLPSLLIFLDSMIVHKILQDTNQNSGGILEGNHIKDKLMSIAQKRDTVCDVVLEVYQLPNATIDFKNIEDILSVAQGSVLIHTIGFMDHNKLSTNSRDRSEEFFTIKRLEKLFTNADYICWIFFADADRATKYLVRDGLLFVLIHENKTKDIQYNLFALYFEYAKNLLESIPGLNNSKTLQEFVLLALTKEFIKAIL